MKVLVTGVCGQLGYDVVRELLSRGETVIATDIREVFTDLPVAYFPLDITDRTAVFSLVSRLSPDAVVHCAAWTAVDAAEDEKNRDTVYSVNVSGTENIADAAHACGAKLVYISTDYVFSGEGEIPFLPDSTDYAPKNYYGKTKLLGEEAVRGATDRHFIVRIAWVFGKNGKNFVRTMLALSEKYDSLRVVSDQIGTPTYTYDLARLLADMIATEKFGTYHATNEGGYISWADFAAEIFRLSGKPTVVVPVTTAEYGLSKAHRPMNSRLSKAKLSENGFAPLPHWQDALARYLTEIRSEEP